MPHILFILLILLSLTACSGDGEVKSTQSTQLAPRPLPSGSNANLGQRLALVIGNGNYRVRPLDNPVADAQDISTTLQNLGFRVTRLVDANQATMRGQINDFAEQLKGGGVGLFYFSGHGLQHQNNNYLIPLQASLRSGVDIPDQAINAQWVLAKLEEANPNGVNLMLLDACRDSPFKSLTKNYIGGLTELNSASGSLVVYATAPNKVAWGDDRQRNSIFTGHLLSYLQSPDYLGLSVTDLFVEVGAAVKHATGGAQQPWQSLSLTRRFCFQPCSSITPRERQALQQAAQQKTQEAERVQRENARLKQQLADMEAANLEAANLGAANLGAADFQVSPSGVAASIASGDSAKLELSRSQGSRYQGSRSQRITVHGRTYIAYDNGTALDTKTNLLWMRCLVGQSWTGSTCSGKAKTFKWEDARKLSANFAGYSDWRIPSIEELRTLVYCSNGKPAYFNPDPVQDPDDFYCDGDYQRPTLVQSVFPSVSEYHWVWSGSPVSNYTDDAWVVYFSYGYDGANHRDSVRHVRLVRERQ